MEPDTIFLICGVCIFILFVVSGVQFLLYYLAKRQLDDHKVMLIDHNRKIRQLTEDMDIIISKIKNGIRYKIDTEHLSLLDMQEFSKLDPYLKEKYKQYIVDRLSPAIMEGINKNHNMIDYLKSHEAEITSMIDDLSDNIRYNGIEFVMKKSIENKIQDPVLVNKALPVAMNNINTGMTDQQVTDYINSSHFENVIIS